MSTISVKTHFAAGHRILNLTGAGAKCRNIHGHTFHVTWTFRQAPGDMQLEFGDLKTVLRGLITTHFDHVFIVQDSDDFQHYLKINDLRFYPTEHPPTTEVIAAEIARLTIDRLTRPQQRYFEKEEKPALWPDAELLAVQLQEGPDNAATWEPTPITVDGVPIPGLREALAATPQRRPITTTEEPI